MNDITAQDHHLRAVLQTPSKITQGSRIAWRKGTKEH